MTVTSPQDFSISAALLGASLVLSACGGPPKAVIGPDHLSTQLYKPNVLEIGGSYKVTGSFAGGSTDGTKLTIEQRPKSSTVEARRNSADGALLAVGTGAIMGDQLYLAWELAAPEVMERNTMVFLLVSELKPSGLEGFSVHSSASGISGTGATSFGKLAVGDQARYSFIEQSVTGNGDEKFEMWVRRYEHQVFTTVTSAFGTVHRGTSLLVGDRLVTAVLSENQQNVPQVAIGVYTIANGNVSGSSVFMDNTVENTPPHGGMGGTLKLPATAEQWAPAGAVAPAAEPASPASAPAAPASPT